VQTQALAEAPSLLQLLLPLLLPDPMSLLLVLPLCLLGQGRWGVPLALKPRILQPHLTPQKFW